MVGELLEALKSAPAVYAAGIAVAAAFLKAGKGLLQFHDEYLRKRPFKRLSYLAAECGGDETLAELVAAAKTELVFREIFGVTASPRFIAATHRLLASGRFSLIELRVSSFYLRLHGDAVTVQLGVWAVVLFWVPLLLVIAMGVYVALLLGALLASKSLAGLLVGSLLFGLYVFFAWFIGRDARGVYVARRVRRKIESLASET